jgi:hypothetical protein
LKAYAIYVKKEEKMMNDAIALSGLLLVYGIPVGILAYWLEKKLHDTGGEDEA